MDELHLFVYGEIGADPMFGQAAPTPEEIQKELTAHPEAKDLVVHISSLGGGVFDGWTIGNIIKNSGKKSICKIEGVAASIATYIALSCDRVEMDETARFMIHNPTLGLEGEEGELEDAAEQLGKIKDDLIKIYKSKTGLSINQLSAMMDKETTLTAAEAKAQGFVDGFMSPVKAVAKFDIEHMQVKKEKDISKFNEIFDKIAEKADKLLKKLTFDADPKNVTVTLANGSAIFVESEDGELEGKNAFTVDEEGNATDTPVEDGTFQLEDGRSITVEGGVVMSVQEASDEIDVLRDQVKDLEKQIAESQKQDKTKDTENKEIKKTVSDLMGEMKNLKALTVGDSGDLYKAHIDPPNKLNNDPPEGHPLDGFAAGMKIVRKAN